MRRSRHWDLHVHPVSIMQIVEGGPSFLPLSERRDRVQRVIMIRSVLNLFTLQL
jgi:hypothetical protein